MPDRELPRDDKEDDCQVAMPTLKATLGEGLLLLENIEICEFDYKPICHQKILMSYVGLQAANLQYPTPAVPSRPQTHSILESLQGWLVNSFILFSYMESYLERIFVHISAQ
ncbi:hypothetical protein ACJX0J_025074 [Zea mays]